MMMVCLNSTAPPAIESPYELLLRAAISIPIPHYLLGSLLILIVFLYNFLEMHFLQDLLTGFIGQPVKLTFNPSSELYHGVVSKCRILHGRYLSTPWLCSPHLQTIFLSRFDGGPLVNYRRELFITSDGGTLALDWVINADGKKSNQVQHDDGNPIVIIVPGLTSDSDSSYIRHLAFKMSKDGRKVVVINHRGLGGVSLTSDFFYFGGWTGDMRAVVKDLHCKYPEAPLFLIGTSIGANMMVTYLGEDGNDVPLIGAAAICNPWDPLICDRFLSRNFIQNFYSKALANGLKGYAHMHEGVISRISNWEGVKKSYYCRDFDNSAFRFQANLETVDTYYRVGCSTNFLGKVKVPLLCISSLDDPICTKEALPWDECWLNDNVVLATTQHGGHLPFFEGLRGKSLWWVRALDEFYSVLLSSQLSNRKKEIPVSSVNDAESSIDPIPVLTISEDGDELVDVAEHFEQGIKTHKGVDVICAQKNVQEKHSDEISHHTQILDIAHFRKQETSQLVVTPVHKRLNTPSRCNQKYLWQLAFSAINTSWPFVGLAFAFIFRKKFQNLFSSSTSLRR